MPMPTVPAQQIRRQEMARRVPQGMLRLIVSSPPTASMDRPVPVPLSVVVLGWHFGVLCT